MATRRAEGDRGGRLDTTAANCVLLVQVTTLSWTAHQPLFVVMVVSVLDVGVVADT